jgi:hypothetical protein
VLASTLLVWSTPLMACQGSKTLLNEDFRFVDDAWARSDIFKIEKGSAIVTAPINTFSTTLYSNAGYGDIDVCLSIVNPSNTDPTVQPATVSGLVFWAADPANHYSVLITPHKTMGINQLSANRWTAVVAARAFDGLRQGAGETNVIRVTIEAGTATVYVNNERFAGIRGQVPENFQGKLGVYAQSEPTKAISWKITSLKVTNLPTKAP